MSQAACLPVVISCIWRTIQLDNQKQNQRAWMKDWLKERLDFRFDNLLRDVEMSVLVDLQTLFMYVPFHFW